MIRNDIFMNQLSSYRIYIGGIIIQVLVILPYILNGNNSYINPHDFLDVTVAHLENIIHNRLFFNIYGRIPLMDGVDRMTISFTSPMELRAIIAYIFPMYWSIVINMFLVKVCAFWGLLKLLNTYIDNNTRFTNFCVSILFSLLPFYGDYGISSAGIPMLIYAYINLREHTRVRLSFMLILFYAMYSSFPLSGIFVCFSFLIFIAYDYFKYKKIEMLLIMGLLILSLVYLLNNWHMITGFLFPSSFISHRQEFSNQLGITDLSVNIFNTIFIGRYHSGDFYPAPILVIFLCVYLVFRKGYSELNFYLFILAVLIVLITIGTYIKILPIQLFASFQFDRFYFLYPGLCFILLGKACAILQNNTKIIIPLLLLCVILLSVFFKNGELLVNTKRLFNKDSSSISYSNFYDEKLFMIVANDLRITQDYTTKVVSLGLYPSIAEFNGFWALDGYLNYYSLDYKHKFRKIISRELEKNLALKSYFDNWGCRCYVFSAELYNQGNMFLCSKKDDISVNNIDINTKALKELGCQYIFSAVDIMNYKDLNLDYVNAYSTPESYWNIRVYKLN